MLSRLALSENVHGFECSGAETAINGVCRTLRSAGWALHARSVAARRLDLHLEKGAAFARRGMMLPPYDTIATLKIFASLISRYDPKIVVSLGDNFMIAGF